MSTLSAQLIAADVSTTITSLAAGVAGTISNNIGSYLIKTAGGSSNPNFGERGVQFVVRATVTSIVFGAVASYMPQTSQNVFFSLLFFNTNAALMVDAMSLSGQVVMAASKGFTSTVAARSTPTAPAAKPCGAPNSCAFSK